MSKKNKKRIISLIMAISIIASAGAPTAVLADTAAAETELTEQVELSADYLTYGDWTYSVGSDDTVYIEIEKYNGSDTDVTIPSEIDGKSVTRIGDYTFEGCTSLESVTIPNCVTTIGNYAFYGCTSLESITIPDGVTDIFSYIFEGCTSLKSVTIPDSVTYIGYRAFYGCTSLKSVTIPDSVTDVNSDAFTGTALYNNEDNWENGVLYINNCLIKAKTDISGDYTIKDGTVAVSEMAFEGCTLLENVTIPDGVTRIDSGIFSGCTSLKNVTIPDSVTMFGIRPFEDCTSLKSIMIPNGVTYMGDYTFEGCTSLESVTVLTKDATFDESVFSECPSTPVIKGFADSTAETYADEEGITFEEIIDGGACGDAVTWVLDKDYTLTISGVGDMYDYRSEDAPWQEYCKSIKSVVIEDGVTSYSACKNTIRFSGLESISIADSVKSIGKCAFFNCVKLSNLTLPPKLENIGSSSFDGYSGSVIIPASVTSIGNAALPTASAIYVDSGNETYKAEDGILFTKDGKTLVQYPAVTYTAYTVPDGVTELGGYAFYINGNIEEVTIPSGVSKIRNYNFRKCNNLKSVTVLNKDATFGDGVFSSCPSTFVVKGYAGSTAETYASENSLNFESLDWEYSVIGDIVQIEWYNGNNTDVTVPSEIGGKKVTRIDGSAFSSNTSVKSITIPDSVTYIGAMAFYSCTALEKVTIPETVTYIGDFAFEQCTALKNIDIAAANTNYTAKDGVFFNKDMTKLIKYPSGLTATEYTVPDSVKEIYTSAFTYYSALQNVTVSQNVETFDARAFYKCDNLMSVTVLNKNATFNGKNVFSNCSSEFVVKGYAGSTAETYASENSLNFETLSDGTGKDDNTSTATPTPTPDTGKDDNTSTATPTPTPDTGKDDNTGKDDSTTTPTPDTSLTYSGIDGTVVWSVSGDTLTIGGSEMKDYTAAASAPWLVHSGTVKRIVIGSGVKNIGSNAFNGMSKVTSVSIPSSVTVINSSAFEGCTSLDGVTLPKDLFAIGDNAFKQTAIKSLSVPNTVFSIGQSAFDGCDVLKEITLPFVGSRAGVSELKGTFSYVFGTKVPQSLKKVTITNEKFVPESAFANCEYIENISLNDEVESIGKEAFSGCAALAEFTIPSGVSKIESYTFKNCKSAKQIVVTDKIGSIGEGAFDGCKSLVSVYVPKLSVINKYTFRNCSSLKAIDVPNSVESIGQSAFEGCTAIASMKVPFIGSSASEDAADEKFGYLFGGDNSKVPSSLTKVEVDFADAGFIADKAFADCKYIKDILITNARKVLDNAFENCTGLKTLCLPERLSDIGETILSGCTSIETLTVPFIGVDGNDGAEGIGTQTSVLGGFFGYDDSKKLGTKQYYSNGNYHYYKIPKTLKNVQVLGQADVPYGAFMNCDYLEKVTIVSGNNLCERAFAYCKSLKSVTLPDNMTKINDYAFAYCTKLETINIPKKVKNLGESIFYGATALKDVVFPNNMDLEFAQDLFNGTNLFADDESPAAGDVDLFADGVVFTCAEGSAAYNYAVEKGIATNVVSADKLNVRKTATTVTGLSDSTYLFDVINTRDDMKGILHAELYNENSKKISEKTMATEDNVEYRVIFTNEDMAKASYAKIYVCDENGKKVSDEDELIMMGEDITVVPTESEVKIKYENGSVTFETNGTVIAGAVLLEAIYNADKTLKDVVIHTVSGDDAEISVSAKPSGSSVKLMLWDGIKTMKALAQTVEY